MAFKGYTIPETLECDVCGRKVPCTKEEYYEGECKGLVQCVCTNWFCEGEHFEGHSD